MLKNTVAITVHGQLLEGIHRWTRHKRISANIIFRIVTFLNRFVRRRIDVEFVRQLENAALVVENVAERRSCRALRTQSCRRPTRQRARTGLSRLLRHERFADIQNARLENATPRLVFPVSLLLSR